ncbi:hypothetical protein PENSPDRAFT_749040 [Peniophora sp. CONT]|nr:hypothetical protein PENSPDRAFT_749040 [Peniophora sp. CONT]
MSTANDAASLRVELKGFERDFKAQHGHAPSVDDIKHAGYAERYKLYKKLSKASSNATASSSKAHAPAPPAKSIVPKSRPQTTDAASASNPFSPRKDKSKRPVLGSPSPSPSHKLPNPFVTPGKAKPKPRRVASPAPIPAPSFLAPDPDPEPEYLPPPKAKVNGNSKTSKDPVSRARKRLRGEPVSPSPVKPKRARTEDTSQTLLPFPSLSAMQDAGSDDEDDYGGVEASTSFVEASPRKGGGPFTLLFEDAPLGAMPIPPSATSKKKSRSKSTSQSQSLFRQRTRSPSRSSDDLPAPTPAAKPKPARKRNGGPAFSFGRGNLYETRTDDTSSASSKGKGQAPPTRPSKRRTPDSAHEDEDAESMDVDASPPPPSSDAGDLDVDLLPPSPPGKDSGSTSYKGKGKSRSSGSRKKSKSMPTGSDDDTGDTSDAAPVTIRDLPRKGGPLGEGEDDSDDMQPEPLFRPGAPIDMPPFESSQQLAQPLSPLQIEHETQLDEQLHRAMDLARPEGGMEGAETVDENRVAHGIMHNARVGWYDGQHGGEVWDAGEWTEGESEDWEGEPVPWAAGEL